MGGQVRRMPLFNSWHFVQWLFLRYLHAVCEVRFLFNLES